MCFLLACRNRVFLQPFQHAAVYPATAIPPVSGFKNLEESE